MRGTRYVDELVERFPILSQCRQDILDSCNIMTDCFQKKGKMLICGNGGSCSDSDHIVGELMKSFEICRPINKDLSRNLEAISDDRGKYLSVKLEGGLPVISLSAHAALLSAISNDIDSCVIFAQQVNSYGVESDVLLAISSSGNSQNVIDAIITAKAKKMTVVGLT
ncbi:MAG: SIS domain-containing protein, partial [Bacteroidota bacterium]|nr:SIS domain-containing protein [Bacteroidota bacterium]